jgi:hypothetical protein
MGGVGQAADAGDAVGAKGAVAVRAAAGAVGVTARAASASEGGATDLAPTWEVVARIANAGTARMPVEVAAANQGERFTGDGKPAPGYRDRRVTIVLGPGEEQEVRIRCPFEPKRLVVDPDAQVMQLQRRAAVARL